MTRQFSLMSRMALCVAVVAVFAPVSWAEIVSNDVYPLDTCAVCSKGLGAKAIVFQLEGREFRACSEKCRKDFDAAPEAFVAKVDEALIAQQEKYYPLDTCLVTGAKLGSMGDPIERIYENRLVRFCCAGCINAFEQDKGKYLSILNEAVVAKQKPVYPLDTCPVMGGKLSEKATEYIAGNRLIRFCCPACIQSFEKEPSKYLDILDEAEQKKAGK